MKWHVAARSGLLGVLLMIWVMNTPGSQSIASLAAGWLIGIPIGTALAAGMRR